MPCSTPQIPAAQPEYFDYRRVAIEAGITPDQLRALELVAAADYPGDQMMFKRRMLRTCNAVKGGALTAAEAVSLAQAALGASQDEAA